MQSTSPQPANRQIVIIHHLSDLHYGSDDGTPEHIRWDRYTAYLLSLAKDKRPDLVVITGDVTETGDPHDILTVAELIKAQFPRWPEERPTHVCVVPGPHDLSWKKDGTASYTPFERDFAPFINPIMPGSSGSPTASIDSIAAASSPGLRIPAELAVYPINTCYTVEAPYEDPKRDLDGHSARHAQFARAHGRLRQPKWWQRRREDDWKAVRRRFLELTDGNPITILDDGIIRLDDVHRFEAAAMSPALSRTPAAASHIAREPLKILVTHHPLLTDWTMPADGQPNSPASMRKTHVSNTVRQAYTRVIEAARKANFHLALHGHMHKPQVLSDLSIMEGSDKTHPLRQIGAASFGETGTFNEIVATRRDDDGIWRIEVRTVNVRDAGKHSEPLVLLNPPEDAALRAETLEQAADVRRKFERGIRIVMRQFSDGIARGGRTPAAPSESLPQTPMNTIAEIIRETVLPDCDVRVTLLQKAWSPRHHVVELVPWYLNPWVEDGPSALLYPASIAGWALALGRPLIYPTVVRDREADPLQDDDYQWLRQGDRASALRRELGRLITEAVPNGLADSSDVARLNRLRDKLEHPGNPGFTGLDIYQPSAGHRHTAFPYFISMPLPRRGRAVHLSDVPEIGVLDVAFRPKGQGVSQFTPPGEAEAFLTADRVQMLETLSDLTVTILTASSALGRPKGSWEDRV